MDDTVDASGVELRRRQPPREGDKARTRKERRHSANFGRARRDSDSLLARQTWVLRPRPAELVKEDDITVSIGVEEDFSAADRTHGRVGKRLAKGRPSMTRCPARPRPLAGRRENCPNPPAVASAEMAFTPETAGAAIRVIPRVARRLIPSSSSRALARWA